MLVNAAAEDPSTASAATATVFAPHDCRSSNVPRTAEPALMTSLTIATRLPRRRARSTAGSRYSTANNADPCPSLCGSKRSV